MTTSAPLTDFADRLHARLQALNPQALPRPEALGDPEFNSLALELFRLQFETVDPLRRFAAHRGRTPAAVTHWRDLPALPASAFKEWDVTSLLPTERTTVFHSSGTTGQSPSRHAHDNQSLALYEASLRPWFAHHLLADLAPAKRPCRILSLTPPPSIAPHSSLAHMADTVIQSFGTHGSRCLGEVEPDGSWTFHLTALQEALRPSEDAPVLLFGTAFLFVRLLDAAAPHPTSFALPPGSRVMETGGYKGRSRTLPKEELHHRLSVRLDLPRSHIVTEYGMSELGSQAYDHQIAPSAPTAPPRRLRFPPWTRTLILSPENGREVALGETGLLRVVDLANVQSVLAVQTEDLAVRHEDGFELVGRASRAEPRGCSLMAA